MQLRCRLPTEHLLAGSPVPRQDFERNENLAAPGMDWKRREQSDKCMGKAGMMGQRLGLGVAGEDPRGERDEARGSAFPISFKVRKSLHRLVVEGEPRTLSRGRSHA